MNNNKNETDNIELRSEKVRHIIGQVPPALVRTGTMIITLVVIALAVAFYTIRYPITIEAQGKVTRNDSVELLVPYKYLYLFDEPRTARISLEGQENDDAPIVCSITQSCVPSPAITTNYTPSPEIIILPLRPPSAVVESAYSRD